MKAPKKNEIVIAFQPYKGLATESRFKADGERVCTWPSGVYFVDGEILFILRHKLVSKDTDRHSLNANPLQTVHS